VGPYIVVEFPVNDRFLEGFEGNFRSFKVDKTPSNIMFSPKFASFSSVTFREDSSRLLGEQRAGVMREMRT
jgi:hypothetical protein